jgi:glycosyltransferase involved in cell wall biosynthesis
VTRAQGSDPMVSGDGDEPVTAPDGLRVAMALYGDVTYDSRVLREAETLARAGHSVTVCCLSGHAPATAPYRVLTRATQPDEVGPDGSSPFLRPSRSSRLGKLRARVRWIVGYARTVRGWGRWAMEAAGEVDVWHAHDLTGMLAVAPLVRAPCRLVYDSHEIFLETGTGVRLPSPLRAALSVYEWWLTRRAVALVTVNEGYASVLRRRLRPRRVTIVRNCPPRWTPAPGGSPLRDALGIPASQPLAMYHGMFSPNRGIEELVDAMLVPGLERLHVALLGFGSMRPELERLAGEPRFAGRLHVVGPASPEELLSWVAGTDVDVIALQHSTLNHWLCTPNKLWESLAAGVPVVVSDFPVMRRIVAADPSAPLGATCDPASPASIAAAIRTLIEQPDATRGELRDRCLRAAHESWNWESESARLISLYSDLRSGG